jgi:hypothetical protein
LGDDKFIGRFLQNGFPVGHLGDVSRNVRSIVNLITRSHTVDEGSVHIYVR